MYYTAVASCSTAAMMAGAIAASTDVGASNATVGTVADSMVAAAAAGGDLYSRAWRGLSGPILYAYIHILRRVIPNHPV